MKYLRDQVSAENPDDVMIAAWALGRLGIQRDIPQLRSAANKIEKPLPRAFVEYALACLGEDAGRQALLRNLQHDDDAIRTYAADTAGTARIAAAEAGLVDLLDDAAIDCRIRAAQSLLMLATKPGTPLPDDISVLVYKATKERPRYTEGSIVEVKPGELLYATTEFSETTSDFARARIIGRTSTDGGQTWGPVRELQPNIGRLNVLGTTLRRLPHRDGEPLRLGMLYSVTHSFDNLQAFLKVSTDGGQTFGDPVLTTPQPGYNIIVSDRLTVLKSGRILLPCSYTTDIEKVNHMVCFCYCSDDGGQIWRKGVGEVDLPKRGAMEPDVVELRDGRILMIMRNQLGAISASHSQDAGETWSDPASLADLRAPESPATIRTIPATGDLLLVWNNTFDPHATHGGARTPLTAAISTDDGVTWRHLQNLESDSSRTYAYTSLTFVGDRAVLSYWDEARNSGLYSSRFRSLPVGWFYGQDAHLRRGRLNPSNPNAQR
jgi:sialidase-1